MVLLKDNLTPEEPVTVRMESIETTTMVRAESIPPAESSSPRVSGPGPAPVRVPLWVWRHVWRPEYGARLG